MHCHLRPLVPPVILGFKHEAHNYYLFVEYAQYAAYRNTDN